MKYEYIMKVPYRWGRTDVTQPLRAMKTKCSNGSVPALQADSHGIQIHGAPAHCKFSTAVGLDTSHVQLKPMFSSAELLVLGPSTASTRMAVPTYWKTPPYDLPERIAEP